MLCPAGFDCSLMVGRVTQCPNLNECAHRDVIATTTTPSMLNSRYGITSVPVLYVRVSTLPSNRVREFHRSLLLTFSQTDS